MRSRVRLTLYTRLTLYIPARLNSSATCILPMICGCTAFEISGNTSSSDVFVSLGKGLYVISTCRQRQYDFDFKYVPSDAAGISKYRTKPGKGLHSLINDLRKTKLKSSNAMTQVRSSNQQAVQRRSRQSRNTT